MKILIGNNNELIIYLNKFIIKGLDFDNLDAIEKYFRKLFLKLTKVYGFTISGYYHIKVFLDDKYGAILNLEKKEIDFYEYDTDSVDMQISIYKDLFLYELEDIFNDYNIIKKLDIYNYKDKYYGNIKVELTTYEMGMLLELSSIIYEETDTIMKYGKKLET